MPTLLLNINPELCKCAKRTVSTKRMSFVKDYRTLIFHDNLTLIIDFKSKSCSPNQLARRTAATLPPPEDSGSFLSWLPEAGGAAVPPCSRLYGCHRQARRRGERKTVLFPRGGRCPLWRLAGKSREGANSFNDERP